jgi:hypothetical protein
MNHQEGDVGLTSSLWMHSGRNNKKGRLPNAGSKGRPPTAGSTGIIPAVGSEGKAPYQEGDVGPTSSL